jgi:nicotinamidase-related amidase
VLLLVDVLNDVDFPGNSQLLKSIHSLGKNISALKKRCKDAVIPVIYVDDNRSKWRSDLSAVLSQCRQSANSRSIRLHSAFYVTPLDTLFSYLKVKAVILAGLITNACILSTASDLYVRDLDVCVPFDCVAAPIKRAIVMRLSS